ncbi:MAG TPA: rod-binding protein [Holophaga sp.]|nr:rod-binding protein [Holophaga sp.]
MSMGSVQRSPVDLATQAAAPSKGANSAENAGKDAKAAAMFEGMLMAQIFQSMRKTIQPSGLFGENSNAHATYNYLLDQAVVEHAVAAGKGWGLAEKLEQSWNMGQTDMK